MNPSSAPSTATGSCYCRGVRFEVRFPSLFCAHCHCANCRRAHGAAFVTWIGFSADRVRLVDGESRVRHFVTDTGATRTFCSRCGSTLFYEGPRWPGERHVALANIDDPVDRAPEAHVFVKYRAAWWTIDDALPRHGEASSTDGDGD